MTEPVKVTFRQRPAAIEVDPRSGPRGLQGIQGPQGQQGLTGLQGPPGANVLILDKEEDVPNGTAVGTVILRRP